MICDCEPFVIKDPTFIIPKNTNCFMYESINHGELKYYLDGKLIQPFVVERRLGKTNKCPWCNTTHEDIEQHIKEHNKTLKDIHNIKISNEAYSRLLVAVRNGLYDALLFSVHIDCPFCITPKVKGREHKCAIPESGRNKFRSLKRMKFSCKNFNIKNYSEETFVLIYRRHPAISYNV